ncbi:sensor domain-containing diguanylate cyclase [Zoogloea sp.]|uniref:GGDEF domain-containing protein n=1 Tax=Zoogloea sp. TaxID=49181 RepID=UPI0026104393|nr:sensor domain-containing diguanylate cyclase [Zoogloea sp.]MDD3352396.1 diguanylate cyclase [Zoogloea sp.]
MFDRISIRYKLIVLLGLSAALALLISSVITIYSIYLSESRASLRVLHQLTDVISENMRAALAFGDAQSASTMLASLRADAHVRLALVSDEAGQPLAEYRALGLPGALGDRLLADVQARMQDSADVLRRPGGSVEQTDNDFMGVLRPVFFEGAPIGVLAVVSDTGVMWAKIRELVLLQVATSVVTLVLLLFLSVKLQSLFTRPIMELVEAMEDVAQTKNYRAVLAAARRDEFGTLHGGFNAMLAEIRERDDLLSRLATTDALTGLANRRHAMDALQTMLARAQRKGDPVGIIMLDIDAFKAVNDRYGHPAGDRVIQEVARVLQANAREYDVVARLGGEEFLVACDGGTQEATVTMAERIRTGVEACRIQDSADTSLHVTVSLGVHSAVPQCAQEDIEQMIRAADQALYRAKEAGRNRYVVA